MKKQKQKTKKILKGLNAKQKQEVVHLICNAARVLIRERAEDDERLVSRVGFDLNEKNVAELVRIGQV